MEFQHFALSNSRLQLQCAVYKIHLKKLIFPDKGVVGIENTHVVTKDGREQFGRYQEEIVIVYYRIYATHTKSKFLSFGAGSQSSFMISESLPFSG